MNIDLYYQVWQEMSGLFLTQRIPYKLTKSGSFDDLDEFVRDHAIEMFEGQHPSEILELIDDATRIAMKGINDV